MTAPDNFIRRWARLKRASDSAREAEAASAKVDAKATESDAEGAADPAFDPASLPSLEQIAADTDIGAFLKSGVPAELTRAALRRAWASDPAIRDFIGIAENQWDFNDPDGIPGFGPLLATDGAPAALTQASGGLENIAEALSSLPVSEDPGRSRVTDPEFTQDQSHLANSGISDSPEKASEVEGAMTEHHTVEEYDVHRNGRRHGSALPR